MAAAGKRADRATTEGLVGVIVEPGVASIVGIGCETEPVSKNDAFQAFGEQGLRAVHAEGLLCALTGAEAAVVPQTLNELNTAAYLNLDNTTSAYGDVSWAFQWNVTLAANGGELDLTKDKGLSVQLIPEPSTLALIALGMGALGLSLRRKSA